MEAGGQLGENGIFFLDGGNRFAGCHTREPSQPLAHRPFTDNLEQAGLPGMVQMRAAAKFPAEAVADLHDTYGVAIFVAKLIPPPRQFIRLFDLMLSPLTLQVM